MSQLRQLQLHFDAVQDRTLMRVSTQDRQEYRFWLTRRFVRVLWPILGQLLRAEPVVQSQPREEARREVLSFQHEQAISETDFKTPYEQETPKTLPLGDAPLLLQRVQVKKNPQGRPLLCLSGEGRGVDLVLNDRLLHSLCKLIAETSARAGWDLSLEVVPAPATPHEGQALRH